MNDTDDRDKIQSKKRWQYTSLELQKALDVWGELSQRESAPSPDEQMLSNMQQLLKDLKHQIDELSENQPIHHQDNLEPETAPETTPTR